MRLLILDRNRTSRRRLYVLFADRCTTVAVASIFAAFRLLRHGGFDAVVVKTAGRDAFALAVLKWLQLHRVVVRTVALLGHAAFDEGEALHRLGACLIVRWPTNERDLRRTVFEMAQDRRVPAGSAHASLHANARRRANGRNGAVVGNPPMERRTRWRAGDRQATMCDSHVHSGTLLAETI